MKKAFFLDPIEEIFFELQTKIDAEIENAKNKILDLLENE